MAGYRKFYTTFWRDDKIVPLKPHSKLVAGYLMSSPQTNRIGLYHFSLGMAIEDTGLTNKEFGVAVAPIFQNLSWRMDVATKTMYIPTWWKHNPPQNQSVLIGNLTDLKEIPDNPLVQLFIRNTEFLASYLVKPFIDCVSHRITDNKQLDACVEHVYPHVSDTTVAVTETVTGNGNKAIPPLTAKSSKSHEFKPADAWIKDFLTTQAYVSFFEHELNALYDPDWWDRTSAICNGIDRNFLERQFAKMGNWFKSHPKRRPTLRFIQNWLEKAGAPQ